MSRLMKWVIVIIAIVALLAGVQFSKHYFASTASQNAISGTVFSPPQPIASFSLIDTKGRPFNNDSLWGHWTLLFFGFTQCAQVCPPTLNNLNNFYRILLQKRQNPMPQVVFVSVDPAHDTLDILGKYVAGFNPHFQGVTGDKMQLDKLAASVNVLYASQHTSSAKETMAIDHSGSILLIDPAGKLAAIFSPPHDSVLLVKDFQTIVTNSG